MDVGASCGEESVLVAQKQNRSEETVQDIYEGHRIALISTVDFKPDKIHYRV
jgi:hypothetical protein